MTESFHFRVELQRQAHRRWCIKGVIYNNPERCRVLPELSSLKFTSSVGVVVAVAINYSCFGCRAPQAFITICAICKPRNCFNKELVRNVCLLCWFTTDSDCVLVRKLLPQKFIKNNKTFFVYHQENFFFETNTHSFHRRQVPNRVFLFLCLQIRNNPRGCTCVTIHCSGISPRTVSCEFPPPRRPLTIWMLLLSAVPLRRRTPGTLTCCLHCTCISIASLEKGEVNLRFWFFCVF